MQRDFFKIIHLSDEYLAFITDYKGWIYLAKTDIPPLENIKWQNITGTITHHNEFPEYDVEAEFNIILPGDTYGNFFRDHKEKRWLCLNNFNMINNFEDEFKYDEMRISEIRSLMDQINAIIKTN